MNDLFLGLDCSTQSLSYVLIDYSSKKIIDRDQVNFDDDLPHYKTINGVIPSEEGVLVHSYPLMWVEALELLFTKMKDGGLPLKDIKAVSGSSQQHGTVYLNEHFEEKIMDLNTDKPLIEQIGDAFSRKTSPIWMDSSTSQQCKEIREALGGMENTIRITGSNTFERFSGPQIRKFYQESENGYHNTSIIHLVSSFLASVLIGKNAPIDHGDGAGMNLMNIRTKEWDEKALEATAPNLQQKLPLLANSFDIIGNLSDYFVKNYNFNTECVSVAWSGDNPNSLIGVGLIEKGKAAISLGTSDTYFGYLHDLYIDLNGEGHVFGAPTGDYMSLICYKNGSLAREKIKDQFNLKWSDFSTVLNRTPPGNYGKIMLPYFFPEIVPLILKPRVYRFGLREDDLEGNVRAIIEAQFLSMRLHSEWIGERPKEIFVTGGASVNKAILKIAANIFNIQIRKFDFTDSAALGAALRAAKSYYNSINIMKNWTEIIKDFVKIHEAVMIKPNKKLRELYNDMLILYKKCESFVLLKDENPEPFRTKFVKKYFDL
ncbi:MAG: xylulokinase [Candidatus Thorarchaeota archaeon]